MSTKVKNQVEKVELNAAELEAQKLLDALNAASTIQSKNSDRSGDRIWTKQFRISQGMKISNSHRIKLAKFFGEIANFVKVGKYEIAIQRFENLKQWADGKLQNLEFKECSNYSNKDFNNPDYFDPNSKNYHFLADCTRQGIQAIAILRLKGLIK